MYTYFLSMIVLNALTVAGCTVCLLAYSSYILSSYRRNTIDSITAHRRINMGLSIYSMLVAAMFALMLVMLWFFPSTLVMTADSFYSWLESLNTIHKNGV